MSARADLTGHLFGEWGVIAKAPAQARKPFWAVEHQPCGAVVDLPHVLLVSVAAGKTTTLPPCSTCTPVEVMPAISHGLHMACGSTHYVGSPCGKAGPGECKHGVLLSGCVECAPLAGRIVEKVPGGTVFRSRPEVLDLDALACPEPTKVRQFNGDEWRTVGGTLDLSGFEWPAEGPHVVINITGDPAPIVGSIRNAVSPPLAEPARTLDLSPARPEMLRNGRGQPMIVPREGGKAIPYYRASSFARTLDDAGGLATWKVRLAGLGIARNPDLAMMAAALEYGDRELDAILETAHDRAGGNAKANWGTAVHSFADRSDLLEHVPEAMRADVDAYFTALGEHGLIVDSLGQFVVNDTYRVAGTFDQILLAPDGRRIVVDLKTGTLHPLPCAIQLALYSGGDLYSIDNQGRPMRAPLGVDQDTAIVAHVPKGEGRCVLHEIDLAAARGYADMALAVRAARKDKALARPMALSDARVRALGVI